MINQLIFKLQQQVFVTVEKYFLKLLPTLNKYIYPYFSSKIDPIFTKHIFPYFQLVDKFIELKFNEYLYLFINSRQQSRLSGTFLVIFIILLFSWLLLIGPLTSKLDNIAMLVNSLNRTINTLVLDTKQLQANLDQNQNQALEKKIAEKTANISSTSEAILAFANNTIETPKLVELIKSKISKRENFKLLKVSSEPAYKVSVASYRSNIKALSELPKIYVHPIEFAFEGDYNTTYELLLELQNSWRFYWDSLDYMVESYPNARVFVRIHLFGLSEDSSVS